MAVTGIGASSSVRRNALAAAARTSPRASCTAVSWSSAALSISGSSIRRASVRARSMSSTVAGSAIAPLNASAVSSRACAARSSPASAQPSAISASTSPAAGAVAMRPGPAIDQLGIPGEVGRRAGPITRAQRCVGRGPTQPQCLVAEMPRLRGAGGAAQGVGGGQVVRGKVGCLLVAPLRLAGHAAGEGQVRQADRQPVRVGAVVEHGPAAQASAPRSSSAT